MKKTCMSNRTTKDQGTDGKRLHYKAPILTNLGDVRVLTQSTGSANGDGGQNMML